MTPLQYSTAHGRGDDGSSRITTRNALGLGQHWSLEFFVFFFFPFSSVFVWEALSFVLSIFHHTFWFLSRQGREANLPFYSLSLALGGLNIPPFFEEA
jgi:hypothetical protein